MEDESDSGESSSCRRQRSSSVIHVDDERNTAKRAKVSPELSDSPAKEYSQACLPGPTIVDLDQPGTFKLNNDSQANLTESSPTDTSDIELQGAVGGLIEKPLILASAGDNFSGWRKSELVDISNSDDSLPSWNDSHSGSAYWAEPRYDRENIPSILVSGIGDDSSKDVGSSRHKSKRGVKSLLKRSVSSEKGESDHDGKSRTVHPEHSLELFAALSEMRESNDMVDLKVKTLAPWKLNCHRGILAAGSPYFRAILDTVPNSCDEIEILSLSPDTVADVIDYIYTHKIKLGQHNAHELHQLCNNEQMLVGKSLEFACSEFLVGQFCLDTGSDTSSLSAVSSSIFCTEEDNAQSPAECTFTENNFPLEVLHILNQDRKKGCFTDLILRVEDCMFHCHKAIFVAVSPYFRAMLTSDMIEQNANEITLRNVPVEIFSLLVEFLYTCKLQIDEDNAQDLLETASFLQIKPVIRAGSKFLSARLDIYNCLEILNFAIIFDNEQLYQDAFNFALQNFGEVIKEEEFLNFEAHALAQYFADDRLNAKKEEVVFDCFWRWLQKDVERRLPSAALVLQNIRLPLIDPILFKGLVKSKKVLLEEPACHALIEEAEQLREMSGQTPPELKDPRMKLRFSMTKEVIIVVGGYDDAQRWVREVWCYNPMENTWHPLAPFPGKNQRFAAIAMNNNIYVIGGQVDHGRMSETLADVWRYNSITDTWTQVASMTKPRHGHGVAVLGNKIYVIGGKSGWAKKFNDIERYDPALNIWTSVTRIKGSYLEKPVATVVEDKLYINGYFYREPDIMHVYDPTENTWTPMFSFERVQGDGIETAVVLNDQIYFLVYRGFDNFVVVFNPQMSECVQGNRMPDGKYLYSYGATIVGDKIYVAGGSRLDASVNVPHVYCYDPALDIWGLVGTMPHPLSEHGCVTIEKYIP